MITEEEFKAKHKKPFWYRIQLQHVVAACCVVATIGVLTIEALKLYYTIHK